MKKILVLLLAVSSYAGAAITTGGNINQWPVGRDSSTNELILKVNPVSSSGSGNQKVDNAGTSVVAFTTSAYVYASATAELVTTSGLAVNVSTVAGASCADCRVYWSTRDAAGVYWDYSNSATIPTILGHYTAASVTATLDDGFVDGQLIHFRPGSTGSVNVFVTVKKRQ
jgi:hypothetical protein